MHIDNAKTGMILAADLLDDRGQLLLEKGIALSNAYITRVKQLGINQLAVVDPIADELRPPDAISAELRSQLADCYRAVLTLYTETLLPDNRLILEYKQKLFHTADAVITAIEERLPQIVNFQVRQPSVSEMTHAINVCQLTVITGLYLNIPRYMLRDAAVGALLHDIGKMVAPTQPEELEAPVDPHPLFGYNLLLNFNMDLIIARIVGEHHEHYDGSGFPLGLSGQAIHPLARLVAIANSYDATITQAILAGLPLHEVMETMMSMGNTLYDLTMLKAFFHTVALYPVGSLVRLNTGQTGYVVKNRPHFPMRPTVRIYENDTSEDVHLVYRPNITITTLIEQ